MEGGLFHFMKVSRSTQLMSHTLMVEDYTLNVPLWALFIYKCETGMVIKLASGTSVHYVLEV